MKYMMFVVRRGGDPARRGHPGPGNATTAERRMTALAAAIEGLAAIEQCGIREVAK
jgi:hypothetical protein